MSDENPFIPKPLSYYEDLVNDKNDISISLDKQEAAIVLKVYDRGLEVLTDDEKHVVEGIFFILKNKLWP